MKRCIGWGFFILLLLPFLAFGQSSRPYSVEIIGAGSLTELLDTHLEIRRHAADADLRAEEIQRLTAITPQQIRDLLATEGYFSPLITAELVPSDAGQNGPPIARFTIVPGDPVRIKSVDISYTGGIANGDQAETDRMNRLRLEWSLAHDAVFRQVAWTDAKSDLLKSLLTDRYPAARIVDSEARIDPQPRTAALSVKVDSGPAFRFGALQIEGLSRYSRAMIDARNPIQPGEPFSQEKLNELQARLQDTGYFKSVFATIEADPAQAQAVPVHLDLTENERKRLALGIGLSTDTGARVQVKWLDRNFMRKDWRLDAELRLDQKTPLASARFYLPARKNGWAPSMDASFERTDIANEISDKMRVGGRVTSPKKNDEQIWGVAYLADRQRIGAAFSNHRQALIGTWHYTRKRLDNLLAPERGYVASVDLALGVPGIINQNNLARVVGQGTWFHPFDAKWLGIVRGQAGQVLTSSRDTIPGDLLFRTGGDQTVRGYGFNSLGVAQDGAIVGGRVFALASAEVVYRMTPAWGAVVFVDAGNAADAWKDFAFQVGAGVGARWRSPIGPVNIDLAYGLETRQPRLHFSVGYGF